jgi:anti-sigma factor RsiW
MKHHDEFRELAALRAYGELDPEEAVRLERHLAQCTECSALALQLEEGIARLATVPGQGDLPAGWREQLDASLADEAPTAGSRARIWIAAASFLVGATLAWSVAAGRDPASQSVAPTATAELGAFERSTPPPRARDGASLPPLAELYLRR